MRHVLVLLAVVAAMALTSCDSDNSGGGGGPTGATGVTGDCEPGYDPCVPSFPPDVDCPNVGGPVSVSGSDPHGLDADSDGVGCE